MKIILLLFFLLNFSFLYSHPHIFIDNSTEITFSENNFININILWKFDDMFSSSLITDYDKNKNKHFENEELKLLYKEAFINLKNYNYFIFLKINNIKFKIDNVYNFKSWIKEDIVYYSFSIKIQNNSVNKIILSIFDPTYFCDISPLDENTVFFKNTKKIAFSYSFMDNEENSFYFGQMIPSELKVSIEGKNENKK